MISDFHNDILTVCPSDLSRFYFDNNIITAIFRGNRSFSEALKLAELSKSVAFEDVGYDDFDVESIVKFKPLYVGLTWNGENRFGFGCDCDLGLKEEGKELVRECSRRRIPIDAAHLSKKGFSDALEICDTVVDSHTCFSSVYEHKRNIDDWQIKEIIERKGLVGVACCGYFMTDKDFCSIEDFIKQIDYFCQKFGAENLAVGSDYYGSDFFVEGIGDYSFFDIAKEALKTRLGYKQAEIDKIFYKNLLDFTKRIKNEQHSVDEP